MIVDMNERVIKVVVVGLALASGVLSVLSSVADTDGTMSLYWVVDLKGGEAAERYPIAMLDARLASGWSDECKTKLVLRCLESRKIPSRDCRIAKPFHSRLSAKMGLPFSLPTEAQWGYACRAGTATDYNNGTDNAQTDPAVNMRLLVRCADNKFDGRGGYTNAHTTVGSCLPNYLGIYDMHGNVWERCSDRLEAPLVGDDPTGATFGAYCVRRGGSWNYATGNCASSGRYYGPPTKGGRELWLSPVL